jgi:hypothetical protein
MLGKANGREQRSASKWQTIHFCRGGFVNERIEGLLGAFVGVESEAEPHAARGPPATFV